MRQLHSQSSTARILTSPTSIRPPSPNLQPRPRTTLADRARRPTPKLPYWRTTPPPPSSRETDSRTGLDPLVQCVKGHGHLERDCGLWLLPSPLVLLGRGGESGLAVVGQRAFVACIQRARGHVVWPWRPFVGRRVQDGGDGGLDAEAGEDARGDSGEQMGELGAFAGEVGFPDFWG